MHVVTATTRWTQAARDEWMHDDRVADLDIRDRGACLLDPTGVLMTGRVGKRDLRLFGPLSLLDVQVGPAQSGSADPHDHVERTDHPGLVDLVELERLVVCVQPRRLHLTASSGSSSAIPRRIFRSERQIPPLTSRLIRTSPAVR